MRIKLAVAVACAVFAGAACSSNVAKPPTIDTVPLTVANTVSGSVDDTASVPTLVTVAPNTAPVETLAIPTSVAPAPLEPDVAEANTIKGTLYLDINSDGVHDANEPGIPNIVVSAEHETSVTNSAGRYSLRNQAGPVTTLRFSSAWFRTQCDSLNCPAGPGKDNNIPVVNQLLVAHDLDASAGLIVNAG